MALRPKQQMFVDEYLVCWSGAEAARRAGYAHPDRQGYRLLRNIEIHEAVQQRMKEAAMDADEVLARLSEEGRVSIADFLYEEKETVTDKDGNESTFVTVGINWEAVKQRGHLIKSIKPTAAGITLELHDAQAALLALAKRHGLLIEKSEGRLDVVEMTLEEWRAKQKEHREQVESTLSDFEDEDA